ncbi:hypothetical protein JCM19296_3206 [Nonlabens ulvanivorans]|uniref:Uncharacterized protein n=1 Tax=Nonlabens ulvanivorans TaxID=906888 RepID=A0A081DFA2_NONUL|nr:hypothetical protein JCM19296_3206 [Nonlabens ulvanivorans]
MNSNNKMRKISIPNMVRANLRSHLYRGLFVDFNSFSCNY